MLSIPVIDIGSTADAATVASEVEAACRDVGFMQIVNHGIDRETISNIREAVTQYFGRPLEGKCRDRISRDNYRGYIPAGFFSPNTGSDEADSYEGYKLHYEVDAGDPLCGECDLYGPNKWPAAPEGFREAVLAYWQACDSVTERLLKMLAVPLLSLIHI